MKRIIQKSYHSTFSDEDNFTNQSIKFIDLPNKIIDLPNEIINTILEYQGYHVWRDGKFISRLNINDKKYDSLKNINIIKKNKNSYNVTISIMKNHSIYKYVLEQKIYSNMVHWYMDKYWYHSIHPNKKKYNKPYTEEIHYVFGKNKYQNLPMLPIDFTYKK
jgi:hypothetical protein